jgi:hypothetical protein
MATNKHIPVPVVDESDVTEVELRDILKKAGEPYGTMKAKRACLVDLAEKRDPIGDVIARLSPHNSGEMYKRQFLETVEKPDEYKKGAHQAGDIASFHLRVGVFYKTFEKVKVGAMTSSTLKLFEPIITRYDHAMLRRLL